MKTRYIREMNRQYYVLSLEGLPKEDYQLPMLLENSVTGLPEVHERDTDGVRELCYEVTSMQPLKEAYESEKLSVGEILSLFLYLSRVIEELDRFLLRGSSLMLDAESIFMRTDRSEILFCYNPCSSTKVSDGLNTLSRFILDHIDFSDRASLELSYALFQESMKESVSLQDFTRLALAAAESDRGSDENQEQEMNRSGEAQASEETDLPAGRPRAAGKREHRRKTKAEKKNTGWSGSTTDSDTVSKKGNKTEAEEWSLQDRESEEKEELPDDRKKENSFLSALFAGLLNSGMVVLGSRAVQTIPERFGIRAEAAGIIVIVAIILLSLAEWCIVCRT